MKWLLDFEIKLWLKRQKHLNNLDKFVWSGVDWFQTLLLRIQIYQTGFFINSSNSR
jgi:hypothetical protein